MYVISFQRCSSPLHIDDISGLLQPKPFYDYLILYSEDRVSVSTRTWFSLPVNSICCLDKKWNKKKKQLCVSQAFPFQKSNKRAHQRKTKWNRYSKILLFRDITNTRGDYRQQHVVNVFFFLLDASDLVKRESMMPRPEAGMLPMPIHRIL